jgi:hypothetical protein
MNNDMVVINLDRPRIMKFRRKELKLLEVAFKCKISKIDFDDIGVDDITKIVHIGLVHEDKDLTLEQVEDLLDETDLPFGDIVAAVMNAFRMSMTGTEKPVEDEVKAVETLEDEFRTLDGKN